ncbi:MULTISPECIES: DUF4279 domain-containing protein [Burkholderia]|uniref:DUF4279 domain-containing protein n=1 Tax=Burkholderia contaminans TaxID=488447 RepID=A0A2S5DZ71_9BURK|nr:MULTISPECIES: DUF4279 domain-containing protein [Burkholderia]EKS9800695.1 DUF4279 domain-containing protein [Burkholderia cepacia]EKS9808297.1 DUF4279 domain-containing protein [Burkholderia cepacia]EKS9815861.1 DUF4279 domain-containing protein [Burkholderia cepacia]EKS9823514.1 DUF4279 domain-containing protein [Burkholderia cepacia]EKS9831152.1 DUF4279 domain-containing protein [Burkholderia cepacia]
MARLRKTMASLRIIGDDLVPSEITRLLGCAPTDAHAKGEALVSRKTGQRRIARFGKWSLRAASREPGNLDAQIAELVTAMTDDLNVWLAITTRYKADIFCGLFMGRWNDGDSISAASLLALGSRGISLDLDMYGPVEDESSDMAPETSHA